MRAPRLLHFATAAVACAACATARSGHSSASRPPFGETAWASPLNRDHPLSGRIWDVRASRFVDPRAFDARLARADLVILGEIHDNPDHHALQAGVLRALVGAGRRPAVAFEMLNLDEQAAVDGALARAPRDPDALARAVSWDRSGWPAFAMYRPIFVAALDAGLPIVAANLSHALGTEIVEQGPAVLPSDVRARIDRQGPLPADAAQALREEMRADHCGLLPDHLLDPMVLAQRARDAQMAGRLLAAARSGRGAVLVTGGGHARTDRGVPAYVAVEAPGLRIASIAFVEVTPAQQTPGSYAGDFGPGPIPYDFLVFTPGTAREDPCEGLRKRLDEPPSTSASVAPAR
jgi:uncharacterized iron-regulated protein